MSQILTELAQKLFDPSSSYTPKVVDVEKQIRGIANGVVIFDTTKAKLVWEHKWFPHYWVPYSALKKSENQSATETSKVSSATLFDLKITNSATSESKNVPFLLANTEILPEYVKLNFADLDEWLEEQSSILYHPKDPYHRVDVLPSGRRIRIEINGVVLADTKDQGGVMSLWETSFVGRWYLPRSAVNFEYLTPSSTHTGCPYKGEASYYHVILPDGEKISDAVWWYKYPLPESAKIEGMLCFYPEKVDMWIDGEQVPKK